MHVIENKVINVKDNEIRVMSINGTNYISLTDLAKYINLDDPSGVIKNWIFIRYGKN